MANHNHNNTLAFVWHFTYIILLPLQQSGMVVPYYSPHIADGEIEAETEWLV